MAGARAEERRGVAAQIDEAAANLSSAKNELGRRERLAESGVAVRQSMDQTCLALGADARYAAKHAAMALMNAPPRTEESPWQRQIWRWRRPIRRSSAHSSPRR